MFPCHSIVQTAQEGRRLCGSLHGDILTDSNASKLQDRSQQSFAVFVSVCAGLSLHRTDPRDIYLALTLLLSQQTLFNVMWARFTMDAAQVTQRWRLHFLIRNRSLRSLFITARLCPLYGSLCFRFSVCFFCVRFPRTLHVLPSAFNVCLSILSCLFCSASLTDCNFRFSIPRHTHIRQHESM